MKKVLILTYYWPPSGGAGVQRWLKFTKYLRKYGWEPVIYTAENAEYPVLDPSLSKDIPPGITVLKRPIWEPYQLYKKLTGQRKNDRVYSGFLNDKRKNNWSYKLSLWLRANIFIPDARRFWIKPSIRYLRNWLKQNPVDLIVSTGPPHSMHLIALGLKKHTGLPWLADFRDPWTNIDFAADLPFTRYSLKKNRFLERTVLQNADQVVVVSNHMQEEFTIPNGAPVSVITNGFDPDDYLVAESFLRKDQLFSIVHTGSLNNRRNHPALWRVLKKLCQENAEFSEKLKIRLIGKNDISVRESIKENSLEEKTEWIDYLPHEQIIAEQKSATILLLSINNFGDGKNGFYSPKGTLTGKLFEYLASARPILMIGPAESQAAEIIKNCKAGDVADFEDESKIKAICEGWFIRFKKGMLETERGLINQFSRVELTGKMVEIFDSLAGNK